MRLISVHNLTKYDAHDQTKLIALAVKIGAPRVDGKQCDVLSEYLESL